MKCPICDGGGRITSLPSGMPVKCTWCNGTGEVMTEQEYLQTCTTEQLAEFLCYIAFDWNNVDKKWVVEWLKQPHTTEE